MRIFDIRLSWPILAVAAPLAVHAQPSFTPLPRPVASEITFTQGISPDGSTVVGLSGYQTPGTVTERPVIWQNGTATILPDLRAGGPPDPRGIVYAASANGSVVVGGALSDFGESYQGTMWLNGQPTFLPEFGGNFRGTIARDVSADGAVVAGFAFHDSVYVAHRWVNGAPFAVAGLPGFAYHLGTGISPDGSTVVGFALHELAGGSYGQGWINRDGVTSPLTTPAGASGVRVDDVLGNGMVLGEVNLGSPFSSDRWAAAVWRDGVPTQLETPAGSWPQSYLNGASGDGTVLVGAASPFPGNSVRAVVWDDQDNMRYLHDILTELGVNHVGWTLYGASAVSADGRTIVGTGLDPQGNSSCWIAVIPAPGWTPLWSAVGVCAVRRRRSV